MKKIFLVPIYLLLTLATFAQTETLATAESILSAAYKQAAKEKKNVFVMFKASWCGWCKKMSASMTDSSTKKYFDDNYVTVKLTVQESAEKKELENPGAAEILEKYKAVNAGLPFFMVLDAKGNSLGNSFVNGENLGCPASAEEVDAFVELLKKTSKINTNGLDAISTRFKKNAPVK